MVFCGWFWLWILVQNYLTLSSTSQRFTHCLIQHRSITIKMSPATALLSSTSSTFYFSPTPGVVSQLPNSSIFISTAMLSTLFCSPPCSSETLTAPLQNALMYPGRVVELRLASPFLLFFQCSAFGEELEVFIVC